MPPVARAVRSNESAVAEHEADGGEHERAARTGRASRSTAEMGPAMTVPRPLPTAMIAESAPIAPASRAGGKASRTSAEAEGEDGAAEALQHAGDEHDGEVRCERGEHGADGDRAERQEVHAATADEVAGAAEQRRGDRCGDEPGGEHPGLADGVGTDVGADRGEHGDDQRLEAGDRSEARGDRDEGGAGGGHQAPFRREAMGRAIYWRETPIGGFLHL